MSEPIQTFDQIIDEIPTDIVFVGEEHYGISGCSCDPTFERIEP